MVENEKASNLCGTNSEEVSVAYKQLEIFNVKPFSGNPNEKPEKIFAAALAQAKQKDEMVAVYLKGPEITGLFVVGPNEKADDPAYCKAQYEKYVKDQKKLRWDKPAKPQITPSMAQNLSSNAKR